MHRQFRARTHTSKRRCTSILAARVAQKQSVQHAQIQHTRTRQIQSLEVRQFHQRRHISDTCPQIQFPKGRVSREPLSHNPETHTTRPQHVGRQAVSVTPDTGYLRYLQYLPRPISHICVRTHPIPRVASSVFRGSYPRYRARTNTDNADTDRQVLQSNEIHATRYAPADTTDTQATHKPATTTHVP